MGRGTYNGGSTLGPGRGVWFSGTTWASPEFRRQLHLQRQKYPISELAEAFRVGVPVEELEQWRAKAKRRPAKRRYYGYYEGLHCGKLGGVCTNPRCTSNNCILAKPHFCAELDGVPEAQQREREEARRASMEFEATLEEALLAANKKPEGSD